ncbi:MAG: efflux RND transporter periplasmic adaptor subunit [Chitinophagales bacterium]
MKRSFLKIVAVIISSIILYACGGSKQAAPNPANMPVPVNLYDVHLERVVYYDKYPATVVALMQVDIRPEVEGYVTGIFFKEGEHVKKGQKLYSIDDSKYQASVNQAQANVRVAEANLDQAQKDADRYNYLNEHEAVAKQILDHAMTTLQNAKSQVTAAKQDLAKAKTDLNYSVIKAPFDGTIGISQVKLGNTVTVGQTILNTISTDGPTAVDFVINEKQIPRFIKLEQKKINPTDSIFTFLLPDNTLYGYTGQISLIDRGVNPQTGTITVRLVFPNPASELRAGMSGSVRVRNDDTAQQLLVPGKAIVEQMGEYFVFTAKDTLIASSSDTSGKNKGEQPQAPSLHAIQKKVVLGQVIGDRVIIRSGLESGEHVVVDGVQKLHDGSLIVTGGKPGEQKTVGHYTK